MGSQGYIKMEVRPMVIEQEVWNKITQNLIDAINM